MSAEPLLYRAERLERDAAVLRRAAEMATPELAGPNLLAEQLATPLDRYLVDVHDFMVRYCAFPSEHEPVAIALWVAHSWIVERFDVSPILAVTSAEMRSGKTRVLDCLEMVCPNPRRMVLPSEAVFYTVLAGRPRPTVLLDELDVIFGKKMPEKYEGIRGVLNSGNQVGTPVLRVAWEGRKRIEEEFDVFGAKAVAGIGDPPATVADRSIPIRMRRRAPDEPVAKFRRRIARREADAIAFPAWERVNVPDVPDVPDIPDCLSDRAMDSWEPLLVIADEAGGGWPVAARRAAEMLSSEDNNVVSIGTRLLEDIRVVFGDKAHLTTADLLTGLHVLDGSPWGDWYGSPLTSRELASALAPYRIGPQQRRFHGEKSRGYYRQDFTDAWRRYTPSETSGTSGTSGTDDDDYPPSATEVD